jgi:hypothetical protein
VFICQQLVMLYNDFTVWVVDYRTTWVKRNLLDVWLLVLVPTALKLLFGTMVYTPAVNENFQTVCNTVKDILLHHKKAIGPKAALDTDVKRARAVWPRFPSPWNTIKSHRCDTVLLLENLAASNAFMAEYMQIQNDAAPKLSAKSVAKPAEASDFKPLCMGWSHCFVHSKCGKQSDVTCHCVGCGVRAVSCHASHYCQCKACSCLCNPGPTPPPCPAVCPHCLSSPRGCPRS